MANPPTSVARFFNRRLPWWTWPAQVIGVVNPSIRFAAARDAMQLAALMGRLPLARWLPLLVAVLAAVVGLVRPAFYIGLQAPFYRDVYTEAPLAMTIALIAGFLAPTLGVLFVIIFGLCDLARELGSTVFPLGYLGRLISYWLLWLLVVEIPLMHRAVSWSCVLPVGEQAWTRAVMRLIPRGLPRTLLGVALGAAMTGVLVYVWTLAAPMLIRPVFVWNDQGLTDEAMNILQRSNEILVVAGIVVALLTSGLAIWLGLADPRTGLQMRPIRTNRLVSLAGYVLSAALVVVALGGMRTSAFDTALLLVALLGARPLAALVLAVPRVRRVLGVIPLPLRFLLGFGLTYFLARPILDFWMLHGGQVKILWFTWRADRPFGSEFFPVVVATALGVLIFAILLGARPEPAGGAPPRPPAGTSTLAMLCIIGLVVVMLWLGTPEPVAAGDCSGLSDCFSAGQAGTAAAAGAAAAAAAIAGSRGAERVGRKVLDSIGFPEEATGEATGEAFADDGLGGKAASVGEAGAVDSTPGPADRPAPAPSAPPAAAPAPQPLVGLQTPPVEAEAPVAEPELRVAEAEPAAPEGDLAAGDDGAGGKTRTLEEGGPVAEQPTVAETPPLETAPAPAQPPAAAGPAPAAAAEAGEDDGLGGKTASLGELPGDEAPRPAAQPPAAEPPAQQRPAGDAFTRPGAGEEEPNKPK